MPGWVSYALGERPLGGWPEGRDITVSEIIGEDTVRVRATNGEETVMAVKNLDLGEEVLLGGEWHPEYSPIALTYFASLNGQTAKAENEGRSR